MKGFIFICMLSCIGAHDFDVLMGGIEQMGIDCMPTVGATTDDLNIIMNHQVPDTHEGKCLLTCIQKKLGMQSQDGTVDKENAKKSISKLKEVNPEAYEKLESGFVKCLDEVPNDDDECKTGGNLKQCIVNKWSNL